MSGLVVWSTSTLSLTSGLRLVKFVVGGKTPHEWTSCVEYFNPIANKWTEVSQVCSWR